MFQVKILVLIKKILLELQKQIDYIKKSKGKIMKENIYYNNYFFVDESGDTTFYNRKGKWVVGKENLMVTHRHYTII